MHARRWAPLAATLLGLALVSGCGMAEQTSAAAVVDGRTITTAEVAETTDQYNELFRDPARRLTESGTTVLLVASDFVLSRARSTGSWSPDAAYNALLAQVPDPTPTTVTLLQTQSALATMQQADLDAVVEHMAKAQIDIDPRIARFDPQQRAFLPVTPNWLQPVPTTRPSP